MARGAEDLPHSEVSLDVQPRATLSADGRYRFALLRDCGGAHPGRGYLVDAEPFEGGLRFLYVANLSPFRAKNPKDLFDKGREPVDVWETNIAVIKAAVQNADLLVAAYGGNGKWERRPERVLEELTHVDIHCRDTTDAGMPLHPFGDVSTVARALEEAWRRARGHVAAGRSKFG